MKYLIVLLLLFSGAVHSQIDSEEEYFDFEDKVTSIDTVAQNGKVYEVKILERKNFLIEIPSGLTDEEAQKALEGDTAKEVVVIQSKLDWGVPIKISANTKIIPWTYDEEWKKGESYEQESDTGMYAVVFNLSFLLFAGLMIYAGFTSLPKLVVDSILKIVSLGVIVGCLIASFYADKTFTTDFYWLSWIFILCIFGMFGGLSGTFVYLVGAIGFLLTYLFLDVIEILEIEMLFTQNDFFIIIGYLGFFTLVSILIAKLRSRKKVPSIQTEN